MLDVLHFVFILWIGLSLGSFASLLAYRWPRKLPWGNTRSKCPSCGHILGARDLIPLVSWLWTRGKCRYCHAKISARYPLLEITAAAVCLMLYAFIGWHWALIPVLACVPFLMALILMRLWPERD